MLKRKKYTNEDSGILLLIAIITFALIYMQHAILIRYQLALPWWIEVPGTLTLFGVLVHHFDRSIWKWSLLHKMGAVRCPVIDGKWQGMVSSSHDGFVANTEVSVTILQSWRHVYIEMKSEHSISHSTVAIIETNEHGLSRLVYHYENTPLPSSPDTMHKHEGTAILTICGSREKLSGRYFCGRERNSYGELFLQKQP